MNKLILFSKLFFILLLIIFLCGGDGYVYEIFANTSSIQIQKPKTSPSASITPTIPATKTISIKSVNGFLNYNITIPTDWQVFKQEDPTMNTLTISNGMYQLVINQAKKTAFVCKYADTKQTTQSMINKFFVSYTTITAQNDKDFYRRSVLLQESPNSPLIYEICQNITDRYQSPTKYGEITYNTPPNPTTTMITEMDTIIGSMQ